MITGLNHITLAVRNLELAFDFYKDILGFKPLLKWDQGAYFLVGDLWFCLSEDQKTHTEPLPEYTHIAFSVALENFEIIATRIKSSGAVIWKDNKSKGNSLYFLDTDSHKLEIHRGDIHSRIAHYRQTPPEKYVFF
jgi:catechol 2,3-dioxygenase-like lactoylglutathione lyase family enzyme